MQYKPEEFDEILNIFKAESEEIIQKFNDRFMEMEKNPNEKAPLKELFQLAHSLKGGSRMIGFNSIQDISHKLEDILFYWKSDSLKINKNLFQVIYKICDFLYELIEKSINKKENYTDETVVDFLKMLDEFISENKIVNKEENNLDYIVNKEMDINAIILELMFVLGKDDIENNFDESITVLKENLEQLKEIFDKTDYSQVKNKIDFLQTYVINSSSQKSDIDYLKNSITELKNIIYSIYKDLNLTTTEKKTAGQPVKIDVALSQNQQTDNNDINQNFDYVLSNIKKIKQNKEDIQNFSNILKTILENSLDNRIKALLTKIINIMNKAAEQNKKFDNNCYLVILQGVFLAKRLSLKDKNDYESNYNSLLQRLSVMEDMYNISGSYNTKSDLNNIISPNPKNEILNPNTAESGFGFKTVDLQEIKTLRVDTGKLDNLISQTGELLINGIKTREHIIELAKINNKLIKWNSVSKKILNYLKYLEKKGFFASEPDAGSSIFYKRTQNFFSDNAELINEINNDFSNLYNIISEDDNKLHQTALEIETIAKGIRVLPLATLFHSFPRMVRDIAKENNKEIDFIVSGSDTSVDKKIIEEIKMPLIHILRNSVSHGIEKPEERIKQGKNATGTIRLMSKQEENNVIITIEDDGYGVNIEKVKEKSIQKGLLTEEEISHMDAKQLMKMLFVPGFSTEESITEISGRGIGLDIVKTKITNLNGEILIDSVLGKGCKITIRLPLSMSTIKTFIILVNNQKYAIPINTIKYVKTINKNEIFNINDKPSIIYESHSVPVYYLSELLGENNIIKNDDQILTIIITENHEKQTAYIVDKLIGDQEVFQKKLIPPIVKIKNISGFTILPTGEICLIINPYELMKNTN